METVKTRCGGGEVEDCASELICSPVDKEGSAAATPSVASVFLLLLSSAVASCQEGFDLHVVTLWPGL